MFDEVEKSVENWYLYTFIPRLKSFSQIIGFITLLLLISFFANFYFAFRIEYIFGFLVIAIFFFYITAKNNRKTRRMNELIDEEKEKVKNIVNPDGQIDYTKLRVLQLKITNQLHKEGYEDIESNEIFNNVQSALFKKYRMMSGIVINSYGAENYEKNR